MIDTHVHLWQYDAAAYPWIDAGSVLASDRLPDDLAALLGAHGVGWAVAVQARSSDDETRWLLALADGDPLIVGVVGWVDLLAADIDARLAAIRHPKLVGVREILQDEPATLLADDRLRRGIAAVLNAGLSYDLLIRAGQLTAAIELVDAVGPGRIVVDHGAKPPIAADGWQPWAEGIAALAARPHVHCKLSGLVTEAGGYAHDQARLERYMALLLETFGAERVMFGSDWPVCTLAASYADVLRGAVRFVDRHCPDKAAMIFGGNARRFYGLANAG